MMIRETMVTKIAEVWDLPLENTWESVLDEGISKGTTNWQLFGSRKPGNEAYELSQHFIITYDATDGEFMMDEKKVADFDLKNNFEKLSVQNDSNPEFEINPKIIDAYNKRLECKGEVVNYRTGYYSMNINVDYNKVIEKLKESNNISNIIKLS